MVCLYHFITKHLLLQRVQPNGPAVFFFVFFLAALFYPASDLIKDRSED